MSNITFRSAFLRFADLAYKKEAGPFARLHFTSEITTPVMEAMEWSEIPDCCDSAKLTGELTARTLELTPNQKELRNYAMELECKEITAFQVFRVQEKDGESTRIELRFDAVVLASGAIGRCERYLRTVGHSPGALKVTYEEQDQLDLEEQKKADEKQLPLPDAKPEAKSKQAAAKDYPN